MRSEFSKWFWSECGELNKDTSFAHSLAEKAWNHRQTEVDELKLQVAEMKSRLNDAYTDGQSAMYAARQSKIDELQKQRDSFIKAYEIEMGESIELQKRVDAAFRVLSQLNALDDEAHKRWKREACMFSQGESNAYEHAVRLLGQALKGGGE